MVAEGYSLEERGERTRVNVGGRMRRPCGTWAAFQRHRNHGEEPCSACAEAASRWKKYEAARNEYKRQRKVGASMAELGRLNEKRLTLELEYRSLETPADTPQPPSRRWKVYRLSFENGQQYVGITSRLVGVRVTEHVSGDTRLTGGSKEDEQACGGRSRLQIRNTRFWLDGERGRSTRVRRDRRTDRVSQCSQEERSMNAANGGL